jgi:hypothetical protein
VQTRQREARQISNARVRQGDADPCADDRAAERETFLRVRKNGSLEPSIKERRSEVRAARRSRRLADRFKFRAARDNARASAQAEKLSLEVLKAHGIHHHYRPLPKVAFFLAYMAGLDRNGIAALQTLRQINMPKARQAQVLEAAFAPMGYTPTRDVCSGKRKDQQLYEYDGRPFGGSQWEEGERQDAHPGAIRVIQCAVFLWLAKGRTRRKGYCYTVRGFGRGVFTSICRSGIDAITGHEEGMPGALLALKMAGFVDYNAPPPETVAQVDRGPTGHAYNMFWFRSDRDALTLEAFHVRTAQLAKLPLIERLMLEPSYIEALAQGPPPPETIDPDTIPF